MRLATQVSSMSAPSTSGRCACGGSPAATSHHVHNRRCRIVTAADQAQYSRAPQVKATDVLSQLLQSKDPHVAARQHIDSLTEEFFMVSSTYLELAKKEKNSAVAKQLEGALKAAMEEKQKTLRPEIQLLNNLLAVNSRTARKQLMNTPQAKEVMAMNNQYFESLVNRMLTDVTATKGTSKNANLQRQLQSIKDDITALLGPPTA